MRVNVTQNTIPREIKGLKDAGPDAMREFVERLTFATHKTAVRGIERGPASGRVYEKYNPRRTHPASAPGQYPATDTGRLASSVEFELPTSNVKPTGVVGTNLLYGKYLEFKPSTQGGRPWLARAFNEATEGAEAILVKVFKRRRRK